MCKFLNVEEIADFKTKTIEKSEKILNYEWNETLSTICDTLKNEKLSSVLKSRNDAILVKLKNLLAKFN